MRVSANGSSLFREEIEDIIIADVALTIAFSLLYVGGLGGIASFSSFLYFVPISFVAVTLSFVLHELMHKFVAQRYGAIAAFKKSDTGIIITLLTSAFGFLIGIPGATMIYASRFTKDEEGIVSLAGPLTNFVVFLVFSGINLYALSLPYVSPYILKMISVTLFISVWLAFFNMLPIYPLDGSKVFRWNRLVYIVMIGVIFLFLHAIIGNALLINLIFALAIALFFSMLYSGMRLF